MQKGYCIDIFTIKGGDSKSTVAINLAGSLSRKQKKVLLVDMGPEGAATYMLGLNQQDLDRSIYGVLINKMPIQQVIQSTNFPNIQIVPSSPDMWALDFDIEKQEGERSQLLTNAIAGIRAQFDTIIIDSHPKYGWTEINSLRASDGIIVPFKCDPTSFWTLNQLDALLFRTKKEFGTMGAILGYLATQFIHEGFLHHKISAKILESARYRYGSLLFNTVISYDESIRNAPLHHEPIQYYKARARGAKEYTHLADEAFQRISRIVPQTVNLNECSQVPGSSPAVT